LQGFKCPRCNSGFIEELELQPQNSFSDESSDGDDVEMVTSIGEVGPCFFGTDSIDIDQPSFFVISFCFLFFFGGGVGDWIQLLGQNLFTSLRDSTTGADSGNGTSPAPTDSGNSEKPRFVTRGTVTHFCSYRWEPDVKTEETGRNIYLSFAFDQTQDEQ